MTPPDAGRLAAIRERARATAICSGLVAADIDSLLALLDAQAEKLATLRAALEEIATTRTDNVFVLLNDADVPVAVAQTPALAEQFCEHGKGYLARRTSMSVPYLRREVAAIAQEALAALKAEG